MQTTYTGLQCANTECEYRMRIPINLALVIIIIYSVNLNAANRVLLESYAFEEPVGTKLVYIPAAQGIADPLIAYKKGYPFTTKFRCVPR